MQNASRTLALAFSGGLDTSYCVPRLSELGWSVHTAYVNTGGTTVAERRQIAAQAQAVGAVEHHEINAEAQVFDRFVRYLIFGNVLRGEVYPLSVAAERTQQAISVIEVARSVAAKAVAHGSTGAGNDQIRFDVALRVLAPDLQVVTPIRDEAVRREQSIAYLRERGLPVPEKAGAYSVNRGLWGTTWGGGWTHDPWASPPPELLTPPDPSRVPVELVISWEQGVPVALDGQELVGPALVARLGDLCAEYGVGRGIHVGETVLGIKGRVGFEAGAALVLIAAHRELEKLVLTKWQTFWKDHVARFYGDRLHEGQYFDPALRDIEALLLSSQSRVSGETRVRLAPGQHFVVGARSPHSMMDRSVATYGEENLLWSGDESRGFARIAAVAPLLAARAGLSLEERTQGEGAQGR